MPKKSFFSLFKVYSNYFLISLGLFACMISFQNCANQLDEGSSENLSILSDNSSFAYKFEVDHMALMTCPPSKNSNNTGGFTIKWGAYSNGLSISDSGLSFTDTWLNQNKENVTSGLVNILKESPKNQNVNIVSGFFRRGSLASGNYTGKSASGVVLVSDYQKLSIDNYIHQLVESPQKKHTYFSRIPTGTKSDLFSNLLEGALYRGEHLGPVEGEKNTGDHFTDAMNIYLNSKITKLHIGMSYYDRLNKENIKLMSSDGTYKDNEAIGSSFTFKFASVGTSDRFLESIQEQSLDPSAGSLNNRWTCPNNLRFMIVAREDLDRVRSGSEARTVEGAAVINRFKPTKIDTLSLKNNRTLQSIVNIIDPAHWDIDLNNKMIIRKTRNKTSYCYPKSGEFTPTDNNGNPQNYNNTIMKVDYNNNKCRFYPSNLDLTSGLVVNGVKQVYHYVCPHAVSICVK